jgi:DNA-binding NarL/FixJ family response regulator
MTARERLLSLRTLVLPKLSGEQALLVFGVHFAKRKRQLLSLVGMGKSNKEIATAMKISETTVRSYLSVVTAQARLTRHEIIAILNRATELWEPAA